MLHHGTIDSSISTYSLSLNVRMHNFFSSPFCSPVFYKINITVSVSSGNKAHFTSLALAVCLEIRILVQNLYISQEGLSSINTFVILREGKTTCRCHLPVQFWHSKSLTTAHRGSVQYVLTHTASKSLTTAHRGSVQYILTHTAILSCSWSLTYVNPFHMVTL